MTRFQTPRSRRRGSAVMVGVGGILLGALVVGAFVMPDRPAVSVDAAGCGPIEPAASHYVLLDVSDPLAGGNARRTARAIDAVLGSTRAGDRVLLATVEPQVPAEMVPVFNRCAPARASETSFWAGGNPRRQGRIFESSFAAPLRARVSALAGRAETPASPIAEHLLAIAADPDFRGRRTIYLLSDGLQASVQANVYRGGDVVPPPRKGSLAKITVRMTVLVNARDRRRQTPELLAAWRTWVEQSGGRFEGGEAPTDLPGEHR